MSNDPIMDLIQDWITTLEEQGYDHEHIRRMLITGANAMAYGVMRSVEKYQLSGTEQTTTGRMFFAFKFVPGDLHE